MSTIVRRIIRSLKVPKAGGDAAPYNQAIAVDRTLYLSGMLGIDPATNKLVDGGAAAEAKQAILNMGHLLDQGDSCYGKVIKTTIYLADINDFAKVNEVYKEFFEKDFPARSTFQVGKLPMNANVEIEVIAATGQVTTVPSNL